MLTTIRRKSHQTRVLTVRSCPGSDEDADTTYSLDQAERFKPKDGITYHRDGHAVLSAQHGCAWQPIAWPQRSIRVCIPGARSTPTSSSGAGSGSLVGPATCAVA